MPVVACCNVAQDGRFVAWRLVEKELGKVARFDGRCDGGYGLDGDSSLGRDSFDSDREGEEGGDKGAALHSGVGVSPF